MTKKKNNDSKAGAALAGAAVGAVIAGTLALLFAPKSGKETREDIQAAVDQATAEIQKLIDKLPKSREDVQKMVDDQINLMFEKFDKIVESKEGKEVKEKLKEARSKVEEKYDELKSAADDGYKDILLELETVIQELEDLLKPFDNENEEEESK